MNIEGIIVPALSLGILGLVFGMGLAYAAKVFRIEADPKVTTIRDRLPGVNCGGCGLPGCESFAKAVAAGEAPVDGCPVGGPELASSLAELMGVEIAGSAKNVAKVICNGGFNECKEKFVYSGIQDCIAANLVSGGSKSCPNGCLGLGTCAAVCQFDAITITPNGLAIVNPDKCTACRQCIEACPKNVIVMVPHDQHVFVMCNSNEPGKIVRQKCSVGCIACQICVKACPEEAIDFNQNLAVINPEKCTNCLLCVEKCPTGSIVTTLKPDENEEAAS